MSKLNWSQLLLGLLLTLAIGFLAVQTGKEFIRTFPFPYGWSELQLSYAGGFVRRGLLGQLAFVFHPMIDARRFLVGLLITVYIVVFGAIVAMVCLRRSLTALVCLLSPVLLLFPYNDLLAFGRKDVFIVGAFVASVLLAKRIPGKRALVAMMAIYVVPGLMHETAWAYFPMAVAFLLHEQGGTRPQRWSAQVVLFAAGYLLVVAVVIYAFRGTHAQADAIISSWQAALPGSFSSPHNAAAWLASDVDGNFAAVVTSILFPLPIKSIIAAAVLTLAPIATYAFVSRPALVHTPVGIWSLIVAGLCMLAPGVLAADWGRYLHIACMQIFVFFLAISRQERRDSWERVPPELWPLVATLVLIYSSSWALLHFTDKGSFLMTGWLYRFFQP